MIQIHLIADYAGRRPGSILRLPTAEALDLVRRNVARIVIDEVTRERQDRLMGRPKPRKDSSWR